MASPIGFDPTHYTNTKVGSFIPGMVYVDGATGCEYRYVKNATDGSITGGMSCVWTAVPTNAYPTGGGPQIVTYSNGASQLSTYASAGLCTVITVAVSLYFFMLVKGMYYAALNASGVTNGSFVTASNAVNGEFVNGAAAQVNKEIGFALANTNGAVFPIMVTVG